MVSSRDKITLMKLLDQSLRLGLNEVESEAVEKFVEVLGKVGARKGSEIDGYRGEAARLRLVAGDLQRRSKECRSKAYRLDRSAECLEIELAENKSAR